jgi:transcriptional regulator with XRE-family HTH domain
VGLLIGGEKETRHHLADRLLDWYGIDVRHHLDSEIKKSTKIGIPGRTEVVVILTDSLPTGVLPKAIDAATAAGLPYVGLSRRSSTWPEPMRRAGFVTPPPWRGDAGMVDATVDDEDEDVQPPKKEAATPSAPAPDAGVSFAAALKVARESSGLSHEDLAGLTGVLPATIESYERAHCGPSGRVYLKLRELFGEALPEIKPRGLIRALAELKQAAPAAPAAQTIPLLATNAATKPSPVVEVPAPTPYVPPMRRDFHDDFHEVAHVHPPIVTAAQPAVAPAPVSAPAGGQATIADYAAAAEDLAVANAAIEGAQAAIKAAEEKKARAVARMIAIHQRMLESLK